jgi:hypothetical protein
MSFCLFIHASPFIVSKERAQVTFMVKKMKLRKDEREKQKKVALGVAVFLLIQWEQFPLYHKDQQALTFWPLRPLVLHDVATLRPVCLCAIEDGRYGCPDLRREGVMWYSCRYPRRCRGMDIIVVE